MASSADLENLGQRFRGLQRQMLDVDFFIPGSVGEARVRCGRATCRCAADPPELHGPYLRWTSKAAGKTVSKNNLTPKQAEVYRKAIENYRRFSALADELREVSRVAIELMTAPAD